MAKIADGTFQLWVDGNTINSSDYTQEREMLRTAVNDNDSRIETLEGEFNGIQLGTAQLQKITADDGNSKINLTKATDDILASVVAEGVGFHTFYAVNGSLNLPSSASIRGVAQITGINPAYGYILAMDYNNNLYTNYINAGKWLGWEAMTNQTILDQFKTDNIMTQNSLWSSSALMVGSTTITPSKKLSECKNGWTLVFSDYDYDTKKTNDFDFNYYNIPKYHAVHFSGKSLFAPLVSYMSDTTTVTTTKRLYIYDDKIVGSDDNNNTANNSNDVVLRAVLEY